MKFAQPQRLRLLAGAIAAFIPLYAAQATDMMDSLKGMTRPQTETQAPRPADPVPATPATPTGDSAADSGIAGPQGPIRSDEIGERPANELPANELPSNEASSTTETTPARPTWEERSP